jgi:translation initiation factor 2 subunit 2
VYFLPFFLKMNQEEIDELIRSAFLNVKKKKLVKSTTDLFGVKKKKKLKDISHSQDFSYHELLSRVYSLIKQNNPEFVEKHSFKLVPPIVTREGSKKTAFANILDISKRLKRTPDHLVQFLFAELGTSGSIDGTQRLVIKGRFQQKQIETVLKKYIMEYVSCKTCRSGDTLLVKENRMFFVQCNECGAKRAVSAIKTGFVAQTGKRPKE